MLTGASLAHMHHNRSTTLPLTSYRAIKITLVVLYTAPIELSWVEPLCFHLIEPLPLGLPLLVPVSNIFLYVYMPSMNRSKLSLCL